MRAGDPAGAEREPQVGTRGDAREFREVDEVRRCIGTLRTGSVVTGISSSRPLSSCQWNGLTGRNASFQVPNSALRCSFSSAVSLLVEKR